MNIALASIRRRPVVLFLCAVLTIAGIAAYFRMGKLEDPAFTIKTAVVTVTYPGSTAEEIEREAAARVEDALQAMGEIKRLRTRCTPGVAIIYVDIKDSYTEAQLPELWNVLRQKIRDIEPSLPDGCAVSVNNDFGDVYGQYYALHGDGFSMRELWDVADFLKKELVLVPEVASVRIIGTESEGIYVEFAADRLAALGMSPDQIFSLLNRQNALSAMGSTHMGGWFVQIAPTGAVLNVEDIGNIAVSSSGGSVLRLRDIASVRRAPLEPQNLTLHFNGKPALGIGIATIPGGNVVTMGRAVEKRLRELKPFYPAGIELNEIYMQSKIVVDSIRGFVTNLIESLVIVTGVLLVFMGLRSGLMIGFVLLLTVAGTFMIMEQFGIFLQVVSLAALIIALGSLVDNAIVVAEGMLVGVQRGQNVSDAAAETVSDSQWAMLGGTFIAVLAFCPIGLSNDSTGEFCRSLLQVVGISMMLSWLLAITVTPVLGTFLLRPQNAEDDPYDKVLFRAYRSFLEFCLRHRTLTLLAVAGLFVFSVIEFGKIDKSFFPDADAVYFVADVWQREGTSAQSQLELAKQLEAELLARPEVKNVTSFTGSGSLRFMLTYSPPEPDSAFCELLVEGHTGPEARKVMLDLQQQLDRELPGAEGVCKLFAKGSSMAPRIEARFYGQDPRVLRELAQKACSILAGDPDVCFARIDWRDTVPRLRLNVTKERMQQLGLSRTAINQAVLMGTTGAPMGVFRDGDRSLPILAALVPQQRHRPEHLKTLPVWSPVAQGSVPLGSALSSVETEFTSGVITRRNHARVITAACDVRIGANASAVQSRVAQIIEKMPLPAGYRLEWGGEDEHRADAMSGMTATFVPCLLAMFTVMVFLFNDFRQPLIIFASTPLILTGVALGLRVSGMSLSFLAAVGILSLVGMLAKNSIVLLDQIAADFASGRDRFEAIVATGVSRLRPVAMSAVTTVLGMIPLIWDNLFASMAVTIMAGLTVSTILTLVVIPVATAVVYRVPVPKRDAGQKRS